MALLRLCRNSIKAGDQIRARSEGSAALLKSVASATATSTATYSKITWRRTGGWWSRRVAVSFRKTAILGRNLEFKLAPASHQDVWRVSGQACLITNSDCFTMNLLDGDRFHAKKLSRFGISLSLSAPQFTGVCGESCAKCGEPQSLVMGVVCV